MQQFISHLPVLDVADIGELAAQRLSNWIGGMLVKLRLWGTKEIDNSFYLSLPGESSPMTTMYLKILQMVSGIQQLL